MLKKSKLIVSLILFSLIATLLNPLVPNASLVTKGANTMTAYAAAYSDWDSSKVYNGGDMVSYHGVDYRAQWWTQGEEPDTAEVWKQVSANTGNTQDWSSSKVYYNGDLVNYNGKTYRAQWWTQGETPGTSSVWVLVGSSTVTPAPTTTPQPSTPPQPTTTPQPTTPPSSKGFKVVGYYPNWQPDKVNNIQYQNLTHINYAFAIPTSDGSLLPLENAQTAQQIIQKAHANGVKVLLSIGGWSYNGVPLEATFVSATDSPDKITRFGNAIIAMAKQYGFDGVDMDWEHPRTDGNSKYQYESLMTYLSKELHKSNMLLTAAVLSGVTPDGNVLWDAAGQTDNVIACVDWFNVMAYDGGDGDRHSPYQFAVNCAKYWRDTRKMPAQKVVLGVPFYGRPSWASYDEILKANPNAYSTDISTINGMQAYYNGIPTIQAKTQWACDNVGGIMIWEISQDTTNLSKSLLSAIGDTVRKNNK